MASPSTVTSLGFGSWGNVNLLPTLGFGQEEVDTPEPPRVQIVGVNSRRTSLVGSHSGPASLIGVNSLRTSLVGTAPSGGG